MGAGRVSPLPSDLSAIFPCYLCQTSKVCELLKRSFPKISTQLVTSVDSFKLVQLENARGRDDTHPPSCCHGSQDVMPLGVSVISWGLSSCHRQWSVSTRRRTVPSIPGSSEQVTVLAAVLCSGGGWHMSSFLLQVFITGLGPMISFLSYWGPVKLCPTDAVTLAPPRRDPPPPHPGEVRRLLTSKVEWWVLWMPSRFPSSQLQPPVSNSILTHPGDRRLGTD